MILTNKKIIAIWNALEFAKPTPPIPREYVFWRNKTKLALEPIIESLEKARKVDEEHWKHEIKKRQDDMITLQKTNAIKDDNGNAVMTPNGEYMIADLHSHNKDAEQIIKEVYKDLYEEEERVKKEYETLLTHTEDVNVKMLPQEKLPEKFDSLDGTTGLFILVE